MITFGVFQGPVEIHIRKEDQPIDGSPLIVHAFDPAGVHLLDLPEKIFAQTVHRFLIDPVKAGKGSLKIAIRGLYHLLKSTETQLNELFA